MTLPYPKSPGLTGSPPNGEIVLEWTAFGISPLWVEQALVPVCQLYADQLRRVAEPLTFDALQKDEPAWDILFLGSEVNNPLGENLLDFVQRAAYAQPLRSVVAVTRAAQLESQLALLRMGAVEVVTREATPKQIEQILVQLIEMTLCRRARIDQEKLRLLNQLTVSVNHEINNPLTGLMGTAELLLLENKDLTEKMRRDLNLILKQGRRIQEVTQRLKHLNHLRTVAYGTHDRMLDLIGELNPEPVETPTPAADAQFLPAPALLVVDDNPLIIDLVARLFEQNYRIEGATSASEALRKIELQAYDLVLIDLILPEMNGLELFRAIRDRNPRQKALLTTAYQGDARVEQAIAEGALGCIYKPFQLEELEKALTEAFRAAASKPQE